MTEEAAKYNAGSQELVDLIRNDAYAASFQSMGQYRRALLDAAPDHIADTGKMVSRPQIREVFLRNGARIESDGDDLPDYVYEATFELLELAAAAVQGEPPFEWPLLNAPALIGGAIVGKGCSTGHVVMIAKRAYQYAVETSPEEHAAREKAFRDVLAQIHEGISHGAPENLWADQEPAPDVAKLQRKLEASFQREEQLEHEVRELRREKFKRFSGEECWIWAGDGSDKLESLMCPVVISPSDLLQIISAGAAPSVAGLVEALERCITSMLDSGYRADAVVIRTARTVLAPHRSRGGAQ